MFGMVPRDRVLNSQKSTTDVGNMTIKRSTISAQTQGRRLNASNSYKLAHCASFIISLLGIQCQLRSIVTSFD